MSLKIRSLVALGMLVCFPLVAVSLAVAIIALGVEVASAVGAIGAKIGIFGLVILVSIVGAVVNAVRARPGPLQGPELTRDAEPALWGLVDALAGRMQVAGPRRIVLVGQVNAGVTEVAGRRELALGLPLLAGMTRGELASVLAHELGHYAHGHTRLVALTYRWTMLLEGVLERMPNRAVGWLLGLYCRLYQLVAASVNREHELQADNWSARLTDPLTAASALDRSEHLDACWDTLVERYLPLSAPARRRASLSVGLRCLLQSLPPAAVGSAPAAERRSRFDSHPAMADRVARLRRMAGEQPSEPGVVPPGDQVPASALLSQGDAGLDALERQLLEDDDPPAGWDEIVHLAGLASDERVAGVAAGVIARLGRTGPVTVADLLGCFVHGHGQDVALPMLRAGFGPQERDAAVRAISRDLLTAAVRLSLAADGRARYALDWTGPMRWQLWYGDQGWKDIDLAPIVEEAATDPARAADLYQTLRSWQARLDLVITPRSLAPTDLPANAFWGHLLLCGPFAAGGRRPRGKARLVDVAIYRSGILLVRPGRVRAYGLNSFHAYAKKAIARCERLLETAGRSPARFAAAQGQARDGGPVARWIPEVDLVDVQHINRPMWGDLTRLRLRSGEVVLLEHHGATVTGEDPLGELKKMSNDR